jgi:hypothetical protein
LGVSDASVRGEREETVREPLDRGDGGHARPGVEDGTDQVGRRSLGCLGHAAPQLDGAATFVPHMQELGEDVALVEREARGGPQSGRSAGSTWVAVELVGSHLEDRTHFVIGRELSGVEVPVEEAHPNRWSGTRRYHQGNGRGVALAIPSMIGVTLLTPRAYSHRCPRTASPNRAAVLARGPAGAVAVGPPWQRGR